MKTNKERTSPFSDTNGMVAALLDGVAEQPVPREAETRFVEICRAVANGAATTKMALDIILMFPNKSSV